MKYGKVSTFEQLFLQRFLAVEMFTVVKGLTPTIINDLFPLKETNN